jgi:hypothetical protein
MGSHMGFRRAPGGFLRAAAGAAALIAATASAVLPAGPAMATDSRARRYDSAVPPPIKVKYLAVPRPGRRAAR